MVGYNRTDRRVLFGISRNICIQWKLLSIIGKNVGRLLRIFSTFLPCFKTLGTSQERHGDLFDQLEEFVCFMYGAKVKSINNLRWKKFDQKPQREHKVVDLASLPPSLPPSVSCNTRNKRP